jgi:hypothetical protein
MITRSRHVVQKTSSKLTIIVLNATLQMFLIQSIKDADHAQLIMFTTMLQKGAIAEFHVRFQDN